MSLRLSCAALAAAVAVPVTLVAASAEAAPATPAHITAKASDSTPASGQTFTVSGLFTVGGKPAGNQLVKVASLDNGTWTSLKGAHIDTTATGTYRLRIVLDRKGPRDLRVRGAIPGGGAAFHRFSVTVH